MDGLFILELLGVLPGSRRKRQAILDELMRLVNREEARLSGG